MDSLISCLGGEGWEWEVFWVLAGLIVALAIWKSRSRSPKQANTITIITCPRETSEARLELNCLDVAYSNTETRPCPTRLKNPKDWCAHCAAFQHKHT